MYVIDDGYSPFYNGSLACSNYCVCVFVYKQLYTFVSAVHTHFLQNRKLSVLLHWCRNRTLENRGNMQVNAITSKSPLDFLSIS